MTEVTAEHYIILATTLFVIGVAGVLIRRNAIVVLMCVELMLNAVNLLMVAFSSHHKDSAGQIFVFFIMVVAAAEVAVEEAVAETPAAEVVAEVTPEATPEAAAE